MHFSLFLKINKTTTIVRVNKTPAVSPLAATAITTVVKELGEACLESLSSLAVVGRVLKVTDAKSVVLIGAVVDTGEAAGVVNETPGRAV